MLTAILTTFTLIAFAANSLLCRMALGWELIDPASFTTLRLLSGAAILLPVAHLTNESPPPEEGRGSWSSAWALFVYAAAFSLAYVSLDTGMGALLLFGAVQVTMIGAGVKSGERPPLFQWAGLVVALGGLVFLASPGISAPDLPGTVLMLVSGIAWGVYSLRGKQVLAPVLMTRGNFVRTVPLALILSALAFSYVHVERRGMILAIVSGAVTSGLGYVLWYRALRGLTTTQASIVQLLVPILAAFGGVVFLAEQVSVRLTVSSVLILGGVALAVAFRAGKAAISPAGENAPE